MAHLRSDLLLAAVFPARCPGCGCRAEPVCGACAARFEAPPRAAPPPGLEAWVAAFAYEGVARELVARAKFHGRHAAFRWLAAAMADAWRGAEVAVPHLVTWAPVAPAHRRTRGVDHGRLLGRAVGAELGVRARPTLARARGPAQTELPLPDRRAGPIVRAVRPVRGTVLLVDDVATTGATLRVCAAALRAAGAEGVVALTATRTGRPGSGDAPAGPHRPTRRASR